jgi:hypothetical protein
MLRHVRKRPESLGKEGDDEMGAYYVRYRTEHLEAEGDDLSRV